jgi:hypothetical protein
MDKKPFKETKVGKFLAVQAPKILDTIGDVLPDKGMLGVVKNLIHKDNTLSDTHKAEALRLLQEFEMEITRLMNADRASARTREVEMAKTGKHDFLMYVTGIIILLAFCVVVYASVFMHVSGDHFVRISTMVETLTVAIVSYYFGYSKASSDKSKLAPL